MRELKISMSKRYCCAKCGAELKENEYVVNLAPLFFMGAGKGTIPVYVSAAELGNLVSGKTTDKEGFFKLQITLEKFFEYAYSEDNKRYLEENKSSAAEALEATEIKLGLRTIVEEPKAEEKEETEKEDNPFGDVFFGSRKPVPSESDDDTFCIPGFTPAMSVQALHNFKTGSMTVKLKRDKEYGFEFENLSSAEDHNRGAGDGRHCPHCKGKILKGAYDKTQLLVGIVGFKQVGKSCLIAALCDYLLGKLGTLAMPEESWESAYETELGNYRRGCTVAKTQVSGENTYNPSVITEDAIWTFVDVPGEAIQDPDTNKFNKDAVLNRFKSITCCDAYVFCADYRTITEEDQFNKMKDVFDSLLNNVENKDRPVLFALTQEDVEIPSYYSIAPLPDALRNMKKEITDADAIATLVEAGGLKNCLHNHYLYYEETRFLLQKRPKAIAVLNRLAENCYLTALSCSAYGFDPVNDNKGKLEPRNIDTIVEWVQRLYGMRSVSGIGEDDLILDGHMLQRNDSQRTVQECEYIARMFVNPSDLDKQYVEASASGFVGKLLLLYLNLASTFNRRGGKDSQ